MRYKILVALLIFCAAACSGTAIASAPSEPSNLTNVVRDDLDVDFDRDGVRIVTFTNADGARCTLAGDAYWESVTMDLECDYDQ